MTDIAELAERADRLVVPGRRSILGITGPPGAGKSTLAAGLLDHLRAGSVEHRLDRVAGVPMDGFHLADVELDRLGLRDRKGAPETFDVSGYVNALRRVRRETDTIVYVPGFDRSLEQPIAGAIPVHPSTELVITEGNYLLHEDGEWRSVHDELDEVWYVDADDAVRRDRLVARHIRFGKTPKRARTWVRESDEANAVLVLSTRSRADLVVTSDGQIA